MDPNYLDVYIEPCPGFGWSGGPMFRTEIAALKNGDEFRNAEWAEVRHSFELPFLNIKRPEWRSIKGLFMAVRGMLKVYRVVDEADHEAVDEQFGTGDGATVAFQLNKLSEADGAEYQRNVYALPSTPAITVNGVTAGSHTVNLRTGVVTFAVAPALAAVLRWTGDFDVWVRFNTDLLNASLDAPNAMNLSVQLIEVPPPSA